MINWIFVGVLVATAVIDFRTHQIRPVLVYALFALAALKIALEYLQGGSPLVLWGGLLGFAVTGFVFWGMYRLSHGIGLGDVRMMAAVGLFYGVWDSIGIVMIAMLLTAGVGMVLVIKDRQNLKSELPFAPFVAGAALFVQLVSWVDRI